MLGPIPRFSGDGYQNVQLGPTSANHQSAGGCSSIGAGCRSGVLGCPSEPAGPGSFQELGEAVPAGMSQFLVGLPPLTPPAIRFTSRSLALVGRFFPALALPRAAFLPRWGMGASSSLSGGLVLKTRDQRVSSADFGA